MLKLIYSLSDKEITLKYQKKSSFWTKDLVLALTISAALHLIAFLLFNIKPLKPISELTLAPGAVLSEIKMPSPELLTTRVDSYGFLQAPPELPVCYTLTTQRSAIDSFSFALEEEKGATFLYDPFLKLEKNKERLPIPKIHLYSLQPPIQIHLSDTLKDRCYGLKIKPKKILLGSTETLHCRFSVEVEDRSGKIFTTDLMQSCGSLKYDHYAKSLIRNLQFEKKHTSFTTRGEVDIIIEADSRDIYD